MSTGPGVIEAASPRSSGMAEHLERVRLFGIVSSQIADRSPRFRVMVAAIYSCRAFSELLLEAAKFEEIRSRTESGTCLSRDEVEEDLIARIPFYFLIERIRIHDFHRFGLRPPSDDPIEASLLGPVTLSTQSGVAGFGADENGIVSISSGASLVKLKRPLLIQNGLFFDEESGAFVDLSDVLNSFLASAPAVLSSYQVAA